MIFCQKSSDLIKSTRHIFCLSPLHPCCRCCCCLTVCCSSKLYTPCPKPQNFVAPLVVVVPKILQFTFTYLIDWLFFLTCFPLNGKILRENSPPPPLLLLLLFFLLPLLLLFIFIIIMFPHRPLELFPPSSPPPPPHFASVNE